ncbi:MAG: hypothetical protein GXP45_05775 [bacterium]|nr:hypothetical protein [bacterium]
MESIDQLEGDFVYRLLYLYPDIMTLQWIERLAKLDKFVPYFDIPLQHINSDLLQRMGRFSNQKQIVSLLKKIR